MCSCNDTIKNGLKKNKRSEIHNMKIARQEHETSGNHLIGINVRITLNNIKNGKKRIGHHFDRCS